MKPHPLASYIDHTLLKPETSRAQIEKLCHEAIEHSFYAVCVNSRFVQLCKSALRGSQVKIASVVGFPLGACTTSTKVHEAIEAVKNGADEIDMVISIGAIKDGHWDYVKEDILQVVQALPTSILKVIIETALLTDDEKIKACQICLESGVHFVKTSTGFNGGGATVSDIFLMTKVVGEQAQVKASGGIKDIATAEKMIAVGATRLGTSSGVLLVTGKSIQGGY